ncbi:MAG TPA: hypothetical protein ENN52_06510 [Methanofollis liminatans]|uniref:S-layer family duplication domain-containing protein n=1 Tax=Methanofollis liminatans TaxID=2201 RepID=A0A831M070_9EURY|nr:hypothetical protein [Methanofollis liminatans]
MKPGPLIISCLLLALLSVPALAAAPERTVTGTLLPGGEFVITLNVSGIAVGGLVETIPEGFLFVSSTHPPGRVSVADRQVSFALLDDERVSYRLRAPTEGDGVITGYWEDFVAGENGTVAPTWLSPTTEPREAAASTIPAAAPGFSVPGTLLALAAILFAWGRSG